MGEGESHEGRGWREWTTGEGGGVTWDQIEEQITKKRRCRKLIAVRTVRTYERCCRYDGNDGHRQWRALTILRRRCNQ